MKTKIYQIKDEEEWKLLKLIIDKYGLPIIKNKMLLSFYNNKKEKYIFRFLNNNIYLKVIKDSADFSDNDYIMIENKSFSIFLKNFIFKKQEAFINDNIIEFYFKNKNGKIRIIFDHKNGNILRYKMKNDFLSKKILEKIIFVNNEYLEKNFYLKNKKEYTFDSNGVLNEKIINYFNLFGIYYSFSASSSLEKKILNKSNDYSFIEKVFKKIFNSNLNNFLISKKMEIFLNL